MIVRTNAEDLFVEFKKEMNTDIPNDNLQVTLVRGLA
jgi:hypothetical protein